MHPLISIIAVGVTILFLILAIAIPKWSCGDLFQSCIDLKVVGDHYLSVGVLILVAILLFLVVLIILVLMMVLKGPSWLGILAAVVAIVGSIFAVAAVLLFNDKATVAWSPFLATIGMTLGIQITVMLVLALILK